MAAIRIRRDELGYLLTDQRQVNATPALVVDVQVATDLVCLDAAWPDSLRLVVAQGAASRYLNSQNRPDGADPQDPFGSIEAMPYGGDIQFDGLLDGPYLRIATVALVDRWLQAPIQQGLLLIDALLADLSVLAPEVLAGRIDRLLGGFGTYLDGRTSTCGPTLARALLESVEALQSVSQRAATELEPARAELGERLLADRALDSRLATLAFAQRFRAINAQSTRSASRWDPIDRLQVPSRLLSVGLDGRDVMSRLLGNQLVVSVPAFVTQDLAKRSERLGARLVDLETGQVLSWCDLDYEQGADVYSGWLATRGIGSGVLGDRYLVDVFDAVQDQPPRIDADWEARNALGLSQDAYTAYRLAIADLIVNETPAEPRRRLSATRDTLSEAMRATPSGHTDVVLGRFAHLIDDFTVGLANPELLRRSFLGSSAGPTLAELDLLDEGLA